jgi:predicted nucleic-acid-binding protein
MIAVDTNVLLRMLVDDADAPRQCAAARALAERNGKVRIAAIVFVEAVWVLQKRYHASRADVACTVRELLEHPHYRVENAEALREALEIFSVSNVELADALALVDARNAECPLYTFDRKLTRLDGVRDVAGRLEAVTRQ